MQASEAQLQETVVALLRFTAPRGVVWFAIPNGLHSSPRTVARFKRQGLKPGAGDLEIIIDGKAHFLELKTAIGRQSPAQKNFELECESGGIPYAIARNFEEARTILTEWGAIREERRAA